LLRQVHVYLQALDESTAV